MVQESVVGFLRKIVAFALCTGERELILIIIDGHQGCGFLLRTSLATSDFLGPYDE